MKATPLYYIVRWEMLMRSGEWELTERQLGNLAEAKSLIGDLRLDNNLRLNPVYRSIRLFGVVETEVAE